MDPSHETLIRQLQQGLDGWANPKTKAWWERYLKQAIPFRGVKMADIRAQLHGWLKQEGIQDQLSETDATAKLPGGSRDRLKALGRAARRNNRSTTDALGG